MAIVEESHGLTRKIEEEKYCNNQFSAKYHLPTVLVYLPQKIMY
jgi:hypothetical protein